jgi:hypothetical protein
VVDRKRDEKVSIDEKKCGLNMRQTVCAGSVETGEKRDCVAR